MSSGQQYQRKWRVIVYDELNGDEIHRVAEHLRDEIEGQFDAEVTRGDETIFEIEFTPAPDQHIELRNWFMEQWDAHTYLHDTTTEE